MTARRRARVPTAMLKTIGVPRGMNKAETTYSQHLNLLKLVGEVVEWKFEWLKFRLADKSWFRPDFFVLLPSGTIEIHEWKGQWREAAKVRMRVAAELHPWFRWRAVQMKRGVLVYEEFGEVKG